MKQRESVKNDDKWEKDVIIFKINGHVMNILFLRYFQNKLKTNCLVNKIIDIELFIWLYYKKELHYYRNRY